MKKYAAPPPEWDCRILLSLVRRSGAPYEDSFELPMDGAVEHWGQTYVFASPVTADISACYTGERILITIGVGARISLPCSRCLSETGLAITGDLRYLFSLRPVRLEETPRKKHRHVQEDREEEDGADDGDVDVIPIDSFQAELDLSPYVWEVLPSIYPRGSCAPTTARGSAHSAGRT
ncbi:MAG: DUF177 domain-containing protein [Synergistaceae bacterium]|nr:DUF177 domain-containing protein [Synergistaceae bacterium]